MIGRTATIGMVLALGIGPATANATPRDIASTHAYIRANYAFARATEAKVGTVQANIEALDQKLGRQCPNVGAGSPQDEGAQRLGYEVAVVLWSTSFGTDAGPIRAFVKAVRRLRWSDHRLARIARSYATSLHELATLSMPDICGDVLSWKASNYKVTPESTARIDRRVEGIEGKTIPPSLLAPYEQPADRGMLAATKRLEIKLERTETVQGFDDWDQTLETLGLNQ